jgi:hypothetical protein
MDWRIAIAVLIALAGLFAAPLWIGSFGLYLLMQMMLLTLFALGFNLLLGYSFRKPDIRVLTSVSHRIVFYRLEAHFTPKITGGLTCVCFDRYAKALSILD